MEESFAIQTKTKDRTNATVFFRTEESPCEAKKRDHPTKKRRTNYTFTPIQNGLQTMFTVFFSMSTDSLKVPTPINSQLKSSFDDGLSAANTFFTDPLSQWNIMVSRPLSPFLVATNEIQIWDSKKRRWEI